MTKELRHLFYSRPTPGHNNGQTKTLEERLWERISTAPGHGPNGDCWEWTGTTDRRGYGTIYKGTKGKDGVRHRVPRLIWKLLIGTLPDELNVLHRCDYPPCVRPDHLFLGTDRDNVLDMYQKGRRPTRLSAEIVRIARRRRAAGETYASLGRSFGVGAGVIRHAVKGITWSHV